MDTITTKQLRENMPEVINALHEGKSIRLTYRRKLVGTIGPEPSKSKTLRRGSPEAIRQGLAAIKDLHIPDHIKNDPRSTKERLAEMRDRDLGVRY